MGRYGAVPSAFMITYVPRRTSTASSAWHCSLQPRAPAGSVPCRTSTANSAWQCFSPDLNRKCQITVGSTGPQHTATQHDHKHTIHNHNHKQKPQAQSQTHNHKHTYTNTQPHTHKAIHTMTNTHSQTQLQTLSHKHNYKHITTSTTTNTIRKKHTTDWRPWRHPDASPRTHKQNPKPQSPRPLQHVPHHA